MFDYVTLEMSLKPFKKVDDDYIRSVCAQVYSQWHALLKNRKNIAVMLWVGDGSEIADYAGNLEDSFEWCRFFGNANKPPLPSDGPREAALSSYRQDYISNAPVMTYGILKKIISCLKEEGKKAFPNANIRIGETFDIGPEFAISDFKYNRHTEICSGYKLTGLGFVDATAKLNADDRTYAAYKNGIPEGTPFGTFLGKQSQIFLKDMGFDYLWLSNGLGFSDCPWSFTGKIFDGEKYYPEKLSKTKEKVFEFWKLFRNECSFPIETRGTNNSVGIDYASDGVPLYDIYNADLDIVAPPNSPWAALNDNYGLEIMGHMTRVCELPSNRFPFRYYIHDPWWINSPWYDRYDGAPCDIYLPMAITRINANGKVEAANSLNILTIDNSYGDMPDQCVNEPLPHLLKAEKNSADEPAPIVWVYPMREYTTSNDAKLLEEMNLGDRFICGAINDGFPLCCVVSTDNFVKTDLGTYKKSVMLSPVPETKEVLDKLIKLSEQGIGVIVYGSKDKLDSISDKCGFVKVCISDSADKLREALATFGYAITFTKKVEGVKPPTLAISRYDNALLFSAYNCNTTTSANFKFPFGAPVLCGCETEIIDGCSTYRFSRGEQRECRVFVEQTDGVVSCRETHNGNARYRRVICVNGLKDATVRLFSEKNCDMNVCLNVGPIQNFDTRFKKVYDEVYGEYLLGEHINGKIYFLMEHEK